MGSSSSKSRIEDLERRQDALMQQNAEMAKHIAQQNAIHKKQHEETIDQMGKFLLVLMQSTNNQTVVRNDKKQIEIDGVTYDITQFINKGGFGEIYKAQARNSNRIVAIKIMKNSPGIQEEIKNEIKFLHITKNITINNHPVIDYYGCKITNEGIFIAMELAVCDLLTFWFNQIKERDHQEKFLFGIMIIIYVLRALVFLEKLNIIHGDIKPQNLVIVQGNQCFYIKLIDFGTVEKMYTKRAQLTVDADKAHTLFFASPEFLKRDSKNMITRHLHKKSDAWAAGVMFYILFFEKLPWKDQYDYENFCNNSRAKDIVVPQQGGYKLIIELLLKKNPQERSSAKATLMQIKSHPVLGTIVQSIEQTFYPVDDVCHMRVPDHIRQQLGKFARPGHFASSPDSSASGSSRSRRSCRYGRECYRHDQDHHEEFAHPGDPDYRSSTSSFDSDSEKRKCRYGSDCFRTDTEHRQKFAHPNDRTFHKPNSTSFAHTGKEKCRFGDNCNKTHDREHMNKYLHD